MSETLTRLSPLSEFQATAAKISVPATAGVRLAERPFLGHLNLRGNAENPAFVDNVQRCLGISLALRPNTLSASETVSTLWLGPDEWLLIAQNSKEGELAHALRAALCGQHAAVTDITDGQAVLCLSGPNALDVIQRGCPLDLHPRTFRPGSCAQTHIAKAPVLIWRADDLSCYYFVVRRSFADYFALWLQDAASDYGFQMV